MDDFRRAKMKESLTNLLKVKSLFSLTAIAVILLSIFFPIPDWVQEICKTIVIFYFGTQAQKVVSDQTTEAAEPIIIRETDTGEYHD